MKLSIIFKFSILLDHLLLHLLLLLLLLRTNFISANHGDERNTLMTLNNSSVAEDDSSPPSTPPSSDSSFSHLTPVFLIVGVVAFVVLLFFFITYYKKYTNLKKQMLIKKNNNNNILATDNHDHDHERALIKDVEKNTEIVVVKDYRHHQHQEEEEEVEEGEDMRGDLIFMNGRTETGGTKTENDHHFELDDLLKASAEGLGKGNFGNCYRAMMERGPIVVVKRLRDLKPLSKEEFVRILRGIAELKHPNLLPLLGYYYSKDEKLLLYKFASHGNAHNRLHGTHLNSIPIFKFIRFLKSVII